MSSYGGQGSYYYDGSPPPLGDKPRSSWVWPVVMGAAAVVAAGLVLLIALQLTDGDDDTATSPTAASSTTAAATTSSAAVAPGSTESSSTSATASAATSAGTQPVTEDEQGDGDDGPVDRSCSSYTVDETLPVQLCARGKLVEEIQFALSEAGVSVEVDGLFGPNTEIAVLEFQSANGLEQDGIVGPATYDALPSVLTEPDG